MLRNIYLIMGPSGSGKTTVAEKLCEKNDWRRVRSITSRPRRIGEAEDAYYFVSKREFVSRNDIIAPGYYADNYYGTTLDEFNKSDLYILEPEGVRSIMTASANIKPYRVIYLESSSESCLKNMCKRSDSEGKVKERLALDTKHFSKAKELADLVVPFADIDKVIALVESYIMYCEECYSDAGDKQVV